jgi:2-alkyl-3-oxoalkanoate reductase
VKVLVTGSTSLLGGAVAELLRARGDDVTVFQRHPSPRRMREVLGDVADPRAVEAAVAGSDVVIHAAAKVDVIGPWSAYEATNIIGTANLLEASRKASVGRFVYVSSPSVAHAGHSLVGVPAGPADPDRARDNYSRSKAAAEQLALAAGTGDLSVVAVRPHLVWGPGDTQLIGRIVTRARQGRLAIVGTGAALIDTTYIDNAADAIVAAADRADRLNGRALVVSNGQPRPVRELLNRIAQAAGLGPPRLRVPAGLARAAGSVFEQAWGRLQRDDEPPITRFLAEQLSTAHWFDQRETRRALGWRPEVDLEEGFSRLETWLWSEAQSSVSLAGIDERT